MDFYTNLTFKVQKGRGLWSCDPIFEILGLLITFEWIEISASNLADILEDGPLLRADHKTTPKWSWPVTRDPISKFRDPFITSERRGIRFKFGTDIEDGPLLRADHKTTRKWAWPGSRDPISKFWDPYNFWTNTAIRFKFGKDIEDGPLLRAGHKTTPKLFLQLSTSKLIFHNPLATFYA